MSVTKIVEFKTRAEISCDADAGYIYIQPNRAGETGVVKTTVNRNGIALDFDGDGRLFGIEFLNASKHLPRFLLDAEPSEQKEMSNKVLYTIQCKKQDGKRWLSARFWLPDQKPTHSWAVAQKAMDEAYSQFPNAKYRIREAKR